MCVCVCVCVCVLYGGGGGGGFFFGKWPIFINSGEGGRAGGEAGLPLRL